VDGGWSTPVNGLQARLILTRTQPLNGTTVIATHLELCNVSDEARTMEVPFKDSAIQFEVVTEQGEKVGSGKPTVRWDERRTRYVATAV
jgi:hypothetical protein